MYNWDVSRDIMPSLVELADTFTIYDLTVDLSRVLINKSLKLYNMTIPRATIITSKESTSENKSYAIKHGYTIGTWIKTAWNFI